VVTRLLNIPRQPAKSPGEGAKLLSLPLQTLPLFLLELKKGKHHGEDQSRQGESKEKLDEGVPVTALHRPHPPAADIATLLSPAKPRLLPSQKQVTR